MNAVEKVTVHLNKLLEFLEPVHELANSHFGSIFTENLWTKVVPKEIQKELNHDSLNSFICYYPRIIANDCPVEFSNKHPNLVSFIQNVFKISLTNDKRYSELSVELTKLKNNCPNCDIKLDQFISQKKLHEVKKLSYATALLMNLTSSSHIVDVGGGKGYLSSILSLHHQFKVLALDSSEITTCGAVKRSENVAKLWEGGIFESCPSRKEKHEILKQYYKQVITFVNPHTDVLSILKENFDDVTGVTLTGLHTCGDLASTCLKIFLNNKEVRGIVNVGCCYNSLNEEFGNANSANNHGFPMSEYLRRRKFFLGRNTRMLAAYSLDRINSSNGLDESAQTSLLYRAMLEIVIKNIENYTKQGQLGKLGKKCQNFHEYIDKANKKLKLNIQLSESDIDQLYKSYISQKPMLTAFFLLRVTLAPIIESIILLDRILYLIENGINNTYLVRLFDLEISPRGFAVIAWKDNS